MQSDFHVHFSPEAAGILAHMANEKNTSIPTLIELLTTRAIQDEREEQMLEVEEYLEAKAVLESNEPIYSMEEAEALLGLAGKI